VGGSPGAGEPTVANPYRSVFINEFLANSKAPQLDFIELFNYSTEAVDLSGCVLTDDPATNKFTIPAGGVIGPQSFLSWDQNQLGFALAADGEKIYVKAPTGDRIIDAVAFGGQQEGVASGRFPDGANALVRLQTPTPGANNTPVRRPEVVINELMFARSPGRR